MNKTSLKKEYYARIKAWKESNPKPERYKRVPTTDRIEAAKIATLGLVIGESRMQTSARLKVPNSSLWNWSNQFPQTVDVSNHIAMPASPKSGLDFSVEIVFPGGARVVDLTAAHAIEFIKALA